MIDLIVLSEVQLPSGKKSTYTQTDVDKTWDSVPMDVRSLIEKLISNEELTDQEQVCYFISFYSYTYSF